MPTQKNNIVHISNTIRSYLGISTYHSVDEDVTRWLQSHKFKQVIVLLIDGMGAYQIKDVCKKEGFLKTYYSKTIQTIYPPTTVAATTALQTGKYPCETAWLGWQQYFPNIKEHLCMFLNTNFYTMKAYQEEAYPYKIVPIHNIVDECREHNIIAIEEFPAFREGGSSSFKEMSKRIIAHSKTKEQQFVYAYWDGYDSFMHDFGATAPASQRMLQEIDQELTTTMKDLATDTGLIMIADHGHIDVTNKYIIDYPDMMDCLEVLPALEARTVSFQVKSEKETCFRQLFDQYFGKDFNLYTKQETIDMQLFGHGKEHPLFRQFLGNYIACAISNVCLVYDETHALAGHHAGMSKEELEIPLILYCKESN